MDYPAAKAYILGRLKKELSKDLYYHGVHHTIDVLNVTIDLCDAEMISPYETVLLKTAALYHDCGFLDTNVGHEEAGCQIARASLDHFYYSKKEIERICGMIMATKIPQTPYNKLEEIICDADLDYLGRNDFKKIGNSLFKELKAYNVLQTEEEWNVMQVTFLENHHFFTETNKSQRAPEKAKHLKKLKKIVAGYKKNC